MLLLNRRVAPNYLREHNQRVYVNDPAVGVLVFDVFGKYLKTLPITGVDRFHFSGPRLFYFSEDRGWESFHLETLFTRSLPVPDAGRRSENMRWVTDRWFVLTGVGVVVYRK